jgi:hypothetical protein
MCQGGRVRFNLKDPMQQRLMDEMLLFPTGDHDDMTDAFIGGLEDIRDWGKGDNNNVTGPTIVRAENCRFPNSAQNAIRY